MSMIFNYSFFLFDYIVKNYNTLKDDIYFVNSKLKTEEFIPSKEYILWHAKYIGTNLSALKLISSHIPINLIKQKPLKYYENILTNLNGYYLELALYDIFFNKIRICILLCGFMRTYQISLSQLKDFFNNYHVDYYICTYDTLGNGSYSSDNYSNDIFNIEDLKKIIPVKNYIIKKTDLLKYNDNIHINKLYYQTLNIYDCYNMIKENYFFYIRTRPDITYENLDACLNEYFTEIVNNQIVVHTFSKPNEHPFDGFAFCNIESAVIYFKFHKYIDTYTNSPEETLYNYLINNNLKVIQTKILGSIIRQPKLFIPTNNLILRMGKR